MENSDAIIRRKGLGTVVVTFRFPNCREVLSIRARGTMRIIKAAGSRVSCFMNRFCSDLMCGLAGYFLGLGCSGGRTRFCCISRRGKGGVESSQRCSNGVAREQSVDLSSNGGGTRVVLTKSPARSSLGKFDTV